MKLRSFFSRVLLAGLLIASMCIVGGTKAAVAQTASSSYAILIVGDESKADIAKAEKSLISEIATILESKSGDAYKFPKARSSRQVYSYHFNKDQEKRYCEKKLDILAEDVLFVGIIEVQPDRYPKRIVYRLDRIVNPHRSALDVVTRIEEFMVAESAPKTVAAAPAAAPAAPATAPATTTKSEAPAASTSTAAPAAADNTASRPFTRPVPDNAEIPVSMNSTATSWRCQIGSFKSLENARNAYMQLQAKGHAGRIEAVETGDNTIYKVYVGVFSSREDAQPTLNRLRDDGFTSAYICAPKQ